MEQTLRDNMNIEKMQNFFYSVRDILPRIYGKDLYY
jgi:hypothetical protein